MGLANLMPTSVRAAIDAIKTRISTLENGYEAMSEYKSSDEYFKYFLCVRDTSVTDMNSISTTGVVAYGPAWSNIPVSGGYGLCVTFTNSTTLSQGDWLWQIALPTNIATVVYVRNKTNNNDWKDWRKIETSAL